MHGLNPYTSFSPASAGTQPFENSAFQHIGYVPTRTTSMHWRKQFPTTRAKLHFTKQWSYAVGCCWFWTHRRHHLRGFGVALRSRSQPGAQFVSLSTLSCEFFDCEILGTSQKFQVSLNLHMLWLNVTWGGGTGHQLFATWCCCHRSWPCCPCHHWWLSRCWDPGSPHLGLALQVTPWAILSNGFASERPQRWHCYSTSIQRRGQDTDFELRAMSASQDMGVGHAFSNAAPPLWCRQQSFSLPLCTDQHPAVISERTTSPINPVASTKVRCRKKEHPSVTDRLPQFPRPGLADSHRQPAIQTAKFTARSCLHWFGAFGWSSGCFLRKRPSDPSDSLRRIFKKHFWLVCFALPFLETFGAVAVRPSRLRGHRVGHQQQGIVEASFGGACRVGWDLFSHHVTTAHPSI